MKNTRKCPKCGCQNILLVPGTADAYGSGNNIMVGATIFSAIKVNRYICTACAYTEEWIEETDLNRLKKSQKAIQL